MKNQLLLLAYLLVILSCKSPQNLQQSSFSVLAQQQLDSALLSPNPAVLVHVESAQKNISWSGATGVSDKQTNAKVLDNQCFRIASVTKTFVACTVLRLIEDGKLTLEDPLSKFVSEQHLAILKSGGYDVERITIRHLLSHTSGLNDHTHAPQFFSTIEKDNSHFWTSTSQLEGLVNWLKPVGGIGEQFSYSDSGYILLGEIIEKITGETLGNAVAKQLNFNKLGLKNTVWEDPKNAPNNPKNRLHQYMEGNDTYQFSPTVDLYGGGGLLSTTKDLCLFFQSLFNHKVFKQKQTLDTFLTKTVFSKTPRMDYRFGIYTTQINGLEAYTHAGFWGTQVVYLPALNTSIAVNYSQIWKARNAPVLEKMVGLLQKMP